MHWHMSLLWHVPTKANLVWPNNDDEYEDYSWTRKSSKANQRTSITWSKANINQITSTSKWTQDFYGHLEMIPYKSSTSFTMQNYTIYGATSLQTRLTCQKPLHAPWDTHKVVRFHRARGASITCNTKMPTEFDVSQGKMNLLRVFWMNEASYEVPWPQVLCTNCRLQGLEPFSGMQHAKHWQPLIECEDLKRLTYFAGNFPNAT